MKRILLILIALLFAGTTFAQTQQGIVKTRGRVVNGKVVAGTRLSGATITLNIGNPQVSQAQGAFSFNVPTGKSYSLVSAKKQGYTLADPEYTRRTFKYSAGNPFYVVLEDEAQRQADINAATRKVRKTLNVQLEKREEEIEALKEQNKITEKEYQERLQQLYDNQSNSEKLVKEMAERYVSTDYDQLDEFQQQIQLYIEEGELLKADSMIQSKGDLDKRVAEYHNAVSANQKERERLEQSEAATAKTYEELSQDLYSKHTIAIQQYRWDEALFYLKQRADLDTTNVDAVCDYADLCYEQKKFEDCEKYYLVCLRTYLIGNDLSYIAVMQNNLGNLYWRLHDYTTSEKYYKLALKNTEQLFNQSPDAYRADLADTQNNLGNLYSDLHDYSTSEKYHKLALENYEQLFNQNPDAYRANLAATQNGLGNLYRDLHDYSSSEKYYKLALDNKEQLFNQNPDAYRADLAVTQNGLGNLYRDLHDYSTSEKYNKLALENYEQLFNQNPDAYRAYLALTQNNLGILYRDLHDYSTSEKYQKLASENYEQLFNLNPNAYRADLSATQHNLGNLYRDLHEYSTSEKYYKLALENYEQLFSQNPDAYRADLAGTQNNLGILYSDLHDYSTSEKYYKLALENRKHLFNLNPGVYRASLADTQNALGSLYKNLHDYASSEKYYKLALENYEQLFSQNPDAYRADLSATQHNLGNLYYNLHDYASSEKYYMSALANREQWFNQNPDAYRSYLAATQNNLGSLYYNLHDYASSEKYYKLALKNTEQLFNQSPDAYRADLAATYWNMMLLYGEMENLEQYDLCLNSALNLYKELYLSRPSVYVDYVIELQNSKVWRLMIKGSVDEAFIMAQETYAMDESNEQSKEAFAQCYNSKAYEYANKSDYNKAHDLIDKAIMMFPDNAYFYDSKGEILLMQGRKDEALEMWKKVLELNPNFLDNYPDGTELSNGLKKLGLIE